ncbi:hypothetical protein D5R93_00720 [Actinomyces lilanjuaniae]|uniref:Uncharacterized protein n=1 Tax=Actinomyces lilanjuaniae TaxID=2321394 RepID=A0ABN5PL71_9ACTO|nr:hypothetical protein [Actinomyces lilanjuaniae]AYD88947.1 hypothetical protein D5R93_00720 [Actinomyces lilanjuaniae]
MVAWSDVCAWRPDPLAEAGDGLRSLEVSLRGLADEAQVAGSRVVSLGAGVEAARAALHRCGACHDELVEEVGALARATAEACEGVVEVRRRVLDCQDFAEARPYLALGGDGSVSVSLVSAATAGGSGGLAAGAAASGQAVAVGLGGAVVEAARAQAEALELEAMVASALALATEVDEDYASALAGGQAAASGAAHASGGRGGRGGQEDQGGPTVGTGLGEPVPGEEAEMPGVDPWVYPGDSELEGSGEHGQRWPNPMDVLVHEAAKSAAVALSTTWPDAAMNLLHYLNNSGAPKHVNVDKMLEDTTSLGAEAEKVVTRTVGEAVEDARASGVDGPVTYPFTTEWEGYYIHSWEDQNWFYATAGGRYATEGTVTVYPPTQDDPEWTYSYDYRVHVADRYNWDGQKSTQILGMRISDEQLQELHQAGIAQEYDLVGQSSVMSGSGP